ncbi:MAG TPA: class I SAM-dependent methyltransferase [Candidatus Saccharimonadia bacterium]|nr:class I SAM-dependent methyltransferase [Candidatus Saccharimonadia bacterium]
MKSSLLTEKWRGMGESRWRNFFPPHRPSEAYLKFCRSQLEGMSVLGSVAILGSTPELRDLVVETGQPEVHVLDISQTFHDSMDALRVYPKAPEILHLGNWPDMLPGFAGNFDAILSDLTLGNIPYDDRQRFFDGIRTALKPGGVFLDKVLTFGRVPLKRLAVLGQSYLKKPFNRHTVSDFIGDYFFGSETLAGVDIISTRAVIQATTRALFQLSSQRVGRFPT